MLSWLSGGERAEEPQQTEVCVTTSDRIDNKYSSVDGNRNEVEESLPKVEFARHLSWV